jgi:hypothetical protein
MTIDPNFVIPLMGAAFIFFGISIRMGNLKQVYWKSRRSIIGYIPLGIVFIIAGVYETASKQPALIFYLYLAFFIIMVGLTIYCTARPPEFMKPTWVRWVEKYPRSVQKAMAAAVDDDTDWRQNVVSEGAVDAWAKQLTRKLPKKK